MSMDVCGRCSYEVPLECTACPHCGGYGFFPNVRRARDERELEALNVRYDAALQDAQQRGCGAAVQEFESAIANSKAVLACDLSKLLAIATKAGVFANYYDLVSLQFLAEPLPGKPDWSTLRPHAEIELLGSHNNIESLHYACLTLTGQSLPNYGECTVLLREDMTDQRASVFQENTGRFVHQHGVPFAPGFRSTWDNRGKLCVAKLANRMTKSTQSDEFPELLLKAGASGIDDEFVEVQVFGDMTIRTFERVTVAKKSPAKPTGKRKRQRSRRGTTDELAVRDLCRANNVPCDII